MKEKHLLVLQSLNEQFLRFPNNVKVNVKIFDFPFKAEVLLHQIFFVFLGHQTGVRFYFFVLLLFTGRRKWQTGGGFIATDTISFLHQVQT